MQQIEFEPALELVKFISFDKETNIIHFSGAPSSLKLAGKFLKLTIRQINEQGKETSYI